MRVNFHYPNITGNSDKDQLMQIKRYLYQLVDQLNNELPAAYASKEEVKAEIENLAKEKQEE